MLFVDKSKPNSPNFRNIYSEINYVYRYKGVEIGTVRIQRQGMTLYSIWNVYVKEKFRGCGHGRRLMQNAINKIKRSGGTKVILLVHPQNEIAKNLYKSLGFAFFEDKPIMELKF